MKALVFSLRLDSLYSLRIPFTWMSALTYPILTPSAIKGLLANALQRYKNDRHPLRYLGLLEDDIIWTGARLKSPCIIKSYITSAVGKWDVKWGSKTTNALGRQFVFAKDMQVVVVLENEEILGDLKRGLKVSPLTCGDSESAATVTDIYVIEEVRKINKDIVPTYFPVYLTENVSLVKGSGRIYPMHDNCLKSSNDFPLKDYIVPITEDRSILKPTQIKIKIKNDNIDVFYIEGFGAVIK